MKTNRSNNRHRSNNQYTAPTVRYTEPQRRARERAARTRARQHERAIYRAQRNAEYEETKMLTSVLVIAIVLGLIYLVVLGIVQDGQMERYFSQVEQYREETVLLDGHRVDREAYEEANEEARLAERELLGQEG